MILLTQTSISSIQYPKHKQTKYYMVGNITVKLHSSEKDVFSILYLNTRSLNKNFESLKTLLAEFGFRIQIICILNPETTESQCSADAIIKNIYWPPGYYSEHQFRNLGQGVAGYEFESFFTII